MGNADRSSWSGLPFFLEDDADTAFPNNYLVTQVANDSSRIYLRHIMEESDEYGFRHNVYLDVDHDPETGFIGTGAGFLPLGADYLLQGGGLFEFIGGAQTDFSWNFLEDVIFDATDPLDIATSITRSGIGSPTSFDFLINAANFDLGGEEDYYPNSANQPDGGFFTYEMGQSAELGIDELTTAVRTGQTDDRYDVNQDGVVNQDDRTFWVHELRNTYFGDANLDGEFNSGDLVTVFNAGQFEDGVANNSDWASGDWSGDGEFDTSDFVVAFTDGGYELGPRNRTQTVPEPTFSLLSIILIGWFVRFKSYTRSTSAT
ncbi:MAG: hypothetical protein R3C28_29295 [Pirellulaceae bacterium]